MKRVLIVGGGAREHALAWKLHGSPEVEAIYAAPGNAGIATHAQTVPVSATDIPALVRLVEECDIGLTVVGPEAPLALGLADALQARGRRVLGPIAAGARIESSKSFAKMLMRRAGVPTAAYAVFDELSDALRHIRSASYPLVVKADGLAAGKGVALCRESAEAEAAIRAMMAGGVFGGAGRRVVIEEYICGPEVSLFALVDGKRVTPLPAAQDHKRLGDGDTGPNTGGMGAYAPVPFLSADEREALVALTIEPIVATLAEMGTPYHGVLFAGLMLTEDGPRVLEYNCRFGDPEAQAILPLLADDLMPWLEAAAGGALSGEVPVHDRASVAVVLASPGYPDEPRVGAPIHGLDRLPDGVLAFHAATALDDGGTGVTAGGRVLTVVGIGDTIDAAAERAYAAPIHFDGMLRRSDIAWQARQVPPGEAGAGLVNSRSDRVLVGAVPVCRPARVGRADGHSGPSLPENSQPAAVPAWEDTADIGRHRVAVLASGEGSNLQALLDACAAGALQAEIVGVVSHRAGAGALERARRAGVPSAVVALADRSDPVARRDHEDRLLTTLAQFSPQLIVLAGWMLVLSADFLGRCPCPLVNLHPALLPMEGEQLDLPVLRGAHALRDAVALRLPFTGVSVHYVTPEVDAGPVIIREHVAILPDDDEQSLYRRIKPIEHRLLVEAVAAVLSFVHVGGVYARAPYPDTVAQPSV
ncbi:MAG TPA: phosphoribosylamine--glycine ligase [Chloroflexota bacterium]